MRFSELKSLQEIYSRWPIEFGKIVEKTLAISLGPRRGGFLVESRSIEGVDISMHGNGEKFAMEVKTTFGETIKLGEKDTTGVQQKAAMDGYIPLIGALRIQLSSEWIIANASRLIPNDYSMARLELDEVAGVQEIARKFFGATLLELRQGILEPPGGAPLTYLSNFLKKESASASGDA